MKVFLAGTEKKCQPTNQAGRLIGSGLIHQSFFSAYSTIQNPQEAESRLREMRRVNPATIVIVDSGAHSFFTSNLDTSATGKRSQKKHDPSAYMAKYLAWLRHNYDLVDYFAELDVGELVGQTIVDRWHQKLSALGMGGKCIRVFHPNVVTEDRLREWFDGLESRYVGLEGVRSRTNYRLDYGRLCRLAHGAGCKVHGFAMVKKRWIVAAPFYSVDSMSWQCAYTYGVVPYPSMSGFQTFHRDNVLVNSDETKMLSRVYDRWRVVTQFDVAGVRGILAAKQIEKTVTRYWERKGIVWP